MLKCVTIYVTYVTFIFKNKFYIYCESSSKEIKKSQLALMNYKKNKPLYSPEVYFINETFFVMVALEDSATKKYIPEE